MMYGKAKELIIDPPHIFIFSNKPCPISSLSSDRWNIKQINPLNFSLDDSIIKEVLVEEDKKNKKSLIKKIFKKLGHIFLFLV